MKFNMLRAALLGAALVGLAIPAQAQIVQYTATYFAGLGDGGNPGTVDNAPNGLPVCNQGLQQHLNAIVPVAGYAELTGGAGNGLDFKGPFSYGTAAATGPAPFQRSGTAGANGAAQYKTTTCALTFPSAVLPAILFQRTQMSYFTWPDRPGQLAPGGGYGAVSAATPTPGAGGGFLWTLDTANTQFVSAHAGPNTFGGGLRGTGGGRVDLGVNAGGGVRFLGFWNTGPRAFGHAKTGVPLNGTTTGPTPTLNRVNNTGIFTNTAMTSIMVPVVLDVGFFPWTTGTVWAEDNGGQFQTIRSSMGNDGRNAAGTTGTLQIVSPWEANLTPFLNLYFGGTARVDFNFTPEPATTGLLAAGVMALIGLHTVNRRRQ